MCGGVASRFQLGFVGQFFLLFGAMTLVSEYTLNKQFAARERKLDEEHQARMSGREVKTNRGDGGGEKSWSWWEKKSWSWWDRATN